MLGRLCSWKGVWYWLFFGDGEEFFGGGVRGEGGGKG